MTLVRSILLLVLATLIADIQAQDTDAISQEPAILDQATEGEAPEEIVVTGVLPGPPLWKVYKDDHTLWIFGYLSPIPRGMQWQSDRVEKVLSNAQEYLPMPTTDVDVSFWVKFNPINIVRGLRLASKLTHNADDKTLQQVLPQELASRYELLKQKYFPTNDDIEELRPLAAGSSLSREIYKKEELIGGDSILKRIDRLANKNRKLKTTRVEVQVKVPGGYSTIAERIEKMVAGITPEQEFSCFESNLGRMETDLEAMKSRANSWAQGYIYEFRGIKLRRGEDDPCYNMLLTSTEGETVQDVINRQQQDWLAAAEKALEKNQSTFAVLNIRELISPNGLLSRLAAKGYEVVAPR